MYLTALCKKMPSLKTTRLLPFLLLANSIVLIMNLTAILLLAAVLQVSAYGGKAPQFTLKVQPPPVIVKGTVKDDLGSALTAATISVLGTTTTVQTNPNGEFTIEMPEGKSVLLISMVGFEPQKVNAAGRSSLTILMSKSQQSLDQVVVVGYGTQKKVNLTGAVRVVEF